MRLLQVLLATGLTAHAAWALNVRSPFNEGEDSVLISGLGKRDQFIFNPCPEQRGKDPQKCSECGGDSKKKGVCDKKRANGRQNDQCYYQSEHICGEYCKCIHDGNGDDDDNGGTVPFPVIPPGFPPTIPPGVPHPLPPKNGEEVCKGDYADRKCSDCEGKSGWCTKGSDVGCPCREDCPAEDKQPKCSDDDCKGDDNKGKCTVGLHKDCDCKSHCPKKEDAPRCSSDECKEKDGKCSTDKYKGCECQEDDIEKAEVNVHPVSPSWLDTQQKFLGKAKDLPEDKPEEKPKCVTTSNTGIVDDDFIKARDEFCKDPSKKYDKDHFELAFKKSSGDCPKDDCKNTLNSIWNTCADYHSRPEPSSDDKLSEHHGPLRGTAEATGKCGKYTAKKTDVKPKFKPPGEDAPAPNGKPFEVSCHKEPGAIGVKKDDMEAAIDEFCKNGRSLDPSKDSRAGSLFKKLDGGTLILHGSPNMGHNPEPIDWYKDKNACHEFDQNIRSDDCKKALKKIYEKCDSDDGDKKLYGGYWTYNCVVWSSRTTGFT